MRKDYTRSEIKPEFESTLDAKPALGGGLESAGNLVRLITQVLDEAARGEDCYLSIGLTKNNDAAIVRLTHNGHTTYASGDDWPSLLRAVDSLL